MWCLTFQRNSSSRRRQTFLLRSRGIRLRFSSIQKETYRRNLRMRTLAPDDQPNGDAEGAGKSLDGGVGTSMMERLVPEVTTHVLSYLDYRSLCWLPMTSSSMRRAANEDNAWKALYCRDFTSEQDSIAPANGWKAYYAATKPVMRTNAEFFNMIKERSMPGLSRLWLNSDCVKCFHGFRLPYLGYAAAIHSFNVAFNIVHGDLSFNIRNVRAPILGDVGWVTIQSRTHADALFMSRTCLNFITGNGRLFPITARLCF